MQWDAREFQEAWGAIISGDLDFPEEVRPYLFHSQLFEDVLNAADIIPTIEHLSDCALSTESRTDCSRVLSVLRERDELDYLQQRLMTSTDPKIQEDAALRLIDRSKSGSSQARLISARMSVIDVLADLFCNFEIKSIGSKATLSQLLGTITTFFGRDCSRTSQIVLPFALRVLRTACYDPDAKEYVGSSLCTVAFIIRNSSMLNIDYTQIFDPHQFRSFFSFLICSASLSWDVINGILDLPREKLGDTVLTSLFLQPEVLDALRHAFSTCNNGGAYCGKIFVMWYKLVVLEPSAVMKMIRLDFLGDTILHMLSSDENRFYIRAKNSSFFHEMPLLMDKMLDVSMQDTIEYFFNRGFCKNLAAAIKLQTLTAMRCHASWDFKPLIRVMRCFEIAAPPIYSSETAVSFDNSITPSAESPTVPAALSERYMTDGRPAWVYDPTYDQFVTPVPIDNLEAFAASSGNKYIAAFFMELLTPTPGDEALSHDKQWGWLINPKPACFIVLRQLLHGKPATKKALFAAAGIHELSRNARDFEPRPDDPTRSYYRDVRGNDVCKRPE